MAEPARKPDNRYEPDYTPPALRGLDGGGETTPDRPARGNLKALNEAEKNAASGAEEKNSVQKGERRLRSVPGGQFKFTPAGAAAKIVTKGGNKKRRGPIAAIIGLLMGGGIFMGISLAPGLSIIGLQETFLGDLDDQLAALDIRSKAVLKTKLKSLQQPGSICAGAISVRCKFASVKPDFVDKLKQPRGAFLVETEPRGNRLIIKSMTLPGDGTRAPITVTNPNELNRALNDPAFRKGIINVYNPAYSGRSGKAATSLFQRLKINKSKPVFTNDVEENKRVVQARTSGDPITSESRIKIDPDDPEQRGQYIEDPDGNRIYESENKTEFDKIKNQYDSVDGKVNNVLDSNVKAMTGVASGAIRAVSIAGIADSACTVYNMGLAVSAASRTIKAVQIAQFAMLYLSTADAIKAGHATPEDIAYLGQRFSEVDMQEFVYNENSDQTVSGDTVTINETKNPFYGKNGWDSPGYSIAAYNDTPVLTSRSTQYAPGGGLSGSLSGVMDTIANTVSGGNKDGIREACKVVQSWWVRGAGLIIGIAAGIGTAGWTTAIMGAGSVAISLSLPLLESMLADIIAGQVIGDSTVGVEAGDALFSGTAIITGGLAQAHGMKPQNKSEMKEYFAVSSQVRDEIAAAEIYAAKDTPFDIYNQYSFLGMAARSTLPFVHSSQKGVSVALAQLPKFIGSAFSGIIPTVGAKNIYKEERFSMCQDPAFSSIDIDLDVFCNIRYGLSNEALNLETDVVVSYMEDNGLIDSFGYPMGDYADFVEQCIERDIWGDTGEENGDTGAECLKDSYKGVSTNYMRVYHMDSAINETFDGNTEGAATSTEIDRANLYSPSSDIQCHENTSDAGIVDGYASGKKVEIRLCSIPNTVHAAGQDDPTLVNSRVSGAWFALLNDLQIYLKEERPSALGPGQRVRISSSFRSMEEQQRIYNNNNCQVSCRVPTARPGYSNHQMGLALDIQLPTGNIGATRSGDVVYDWLTANAGQYGFKKLSSESWHWEPRQ